MTQFDDINEALVALQNEMKTATSATQSISRLGVIADKMAQNAAAVDARLQACESRIAAIVPSLSAVNQSIEKLSALTSTQWKDAISSVVAGIGNKFVDAVASQVKTAGADFTSSVDALRAEWVQREQALKRARKWIWTLSSMLIIILLAIAGAVGSGLLLGA